MHLRYRSILLVPACLVAFVGLASGQILINEIRVDNTGSDSDEYFELIGPPGAPLTDLYYVVLGDGSSSSNTGGCSGVVESVTNLSAYSILADGYFALGNSTPAAPATLTYDATAPLAFENTDTVTHMLVSGFTGTGVSQDLDTNDDGVLDVTPWTQVLDSVALYRGFPYNCPATGSNDEWPYSPTVVGPSGAFAPAGIRRCSTGWVLMPLALGVDTPGSVNNCTVPVYSMPWSQVKILFR